MVLFMLYDLGFFEKKIFFNIFYCQFQYLMSLNYGSKHKKNVEK